MSELDDATTKLESWCRRLIETYLERSVTITPKKTGVTAKGGGRLSGTRPQPEQKQEQKKQQPSAAENGRPSLDTSCSAARGGTSGHVAVEQNTSQDSLSPSQELVQLIDAVQKEPSQHERRRGGDDRVAAEKPLVPDALPRDMKTNIFRVTRQQFSELYGVETALESVGTGAVTRCELVAMYLRSFRNVLNYDLLELREHETYFSRIVGYCTYVLQDLVEALFPEKSHHNIVSHNKKIINVYNNQNNLIHRSRY